MRTTRVLGRIGKSITKIRATGINWVTFKYDKGDERSILPPPAIMDPFQELIVYLRVAQAFKERLQMPDRDRALLMAGTCAHVLQMTAIANFCQKLILQNNQGHMLRNYQDFAEACDDSDFGSLLKSVRRKLGPEQAEAKIMSLNYRCNVFPGDYDSKEAFAAAVMGVDIDWLNENFN